DADVADRVLQGFIEMGRDQIRKFQPVPPEVVAGYTQTLTANNLQKVNDLRRLKESRYLAAMLEIDKSAVPFPDEPPTRFPPLAFWKAITKLRKEFRNYEASYLPDDDQGRKLMEDTYSLLNEPIDMSSFPRNIKLLDALDIFKEQIKDKYKGKKKLIIIIDYDTIKAANQEAEELATTNVQMKQKLDFPIALATALEMVLAQYPAKSEQTSLTFVVRRQYIEITTVERQEREKV